VSRVPRPVGHLAGEVTEVVKATIVKLPGQLLDRQADHDPGDLAGLLGHLLESDLAGHPAELAGEVPGDPTGTLPGHLGDHSADSGVTLEHLVQSHFSTLALD